MIRILLVQSSSANLGDPVIADNVRYLVQKILSSCKEEAEILDYYIGKEDIYQIYFADMIIFVGGGIIKYKQENFYYRVSDIIEEADKYHIPVFLNAVGVEDYDDADERCLQLKRAINLPCVQAITVRDDLQTLKSRWITNPRIKTASVFDPAVWSYCTYHKMQHGNGKRDSATLKIGIGIAREDIFADYGHPEIDKAYLINFYRDLIAGLQKKGMECILFTNGLKRDEEFAQEVLEQCGEGIRKVPKPVHTPDLLNVIDGLDGMIATRMHSNIIAFSLRIPSIGLVWNSKLSSFFHKIGYPERAVSANEIRADFVIHKLEAALKKGCKKTGFWARYGSYLYLKRFVKKNFRKLEKPEERESHLIDIEELHKHLMKAACGGLYGRYKNLNAAIALEMSLQSQWPWIEIDVRMDEEGKLVCVNGIGKENPDFPIMTFSECCGIIKRAKAEGEIPKIILDVGKPKKGQIDTFYVMLVKELKKHDLDEKKMFFRLQRKKDVGQLEKVEHHCSIAYYLGAPVEGENYERTVQQVITYCKKQKITYISMGKNTFNQKVAEQLHEAKLKIMVFSYATLGEAASAVEQGADYVGVL